MMSSVSRRLRAICRTSLECLIQAKVQTLATFLETAPGYERGGRYVIVTRVSAGCTVCEDHVPSGQSTCTVVG